MVLPERGELAPLLEDAGAEVVVRPLAVLRRGLMNPAGLAAIAGRLAADRRALADLARSRHAALVHQNTSVILSAPPGLPRVTHVREIYSGAPALAWSALRRRIEAADELLCVSAAVRAQFSKGNVVHDGLPPVPGLADRAAARHELFIQDGEFAVLLAGRISDWKGQDVLARALAAPGMEHVVGLIAGNAWKGEEHRERELRELAETLRIGGRLRLLGFRADLDPLYAAADAAAVPSRRPDPLPNSALEAAAAGLPVVAANHGGLPEIVRDGETGLLVEPGDPRALATAIRSLAADPERAEQMGEAAKQDVTRRFAPQKMLDGVQAAFERAARPTA